MDEVGRRLGHGQPVTTARYLRFLGDEDPRAAVDRIWPDVR